MSLFQKSKSITVLTVGLAAGIGIGSIGTATLAARQDSMARPGATATQNAPNPQERTLDANVFMQTSAEYAACCLQTYGWATERLRQKLAANHTPDRKPAVIMDLDETVLDNAGYQSFLDREKTTYKKETWTIWERDNATETRLIPGAKAFIEAAEQAGVAVVYISNRATPYKDSCIAALKHHGINTDGIADRLLLRDDGAPSDKTARRAMVAEKYAVVMLVGDNLRDLSEEFVSPNLKDATLDARRAAITDRINKVKRANYRFGNDWIILPNPVYGEWQTVAGNDPRQVLRPTTMNAK